MATYKNSVSKEAIEQEWLLIQAAQKNNARFSTLYERYYEQIFRFIYLRTADEDICADLCADTFIKAMKNLHKYSHKGVPFSAWLYTIASNEVKQYFRKTNKTRIVTLEDSFVNNLKDEFDDKAGHELNLTVLKEVINQLKADEIEMVELRFFEERPFKEISDILNITETNAKVRMHRIIQKMKELFDRLVKTKKS